MADVPGLLGRFLTGDQRNPLQYDSTVFGAEAPQSALEALELLKRNADQAEAVAYIIRNHDGNLDDAVSFSTVRAIEHSFREQIGRDQNIVHRGLYAAALRSLPAAVELIRDQQEGAAGEQFKKDSNYYLTHERFGVESKAQRHLDNFIGQERNNDLNHVSSDLPGRGKSLVQGPEIFIPVSNIPSVVPLASAAAGVFSPTVIASTARDSTSAEKYEAQGFVGPSEFVGPLAAPVSQKQEFVGPSLPSVEGTSWQKAVSDPFSSTPAKKEEPVVSEKKASPVKVSVQAGVSVDPEIQEIQALLRLGAGMDIQNMSGRLDAATKEAIDQYAMLNKQNRNISIHELHQHLVERMNNEEHFRNLARVNALAALDVGQNVPQSSARDSIKAGQILLNFENLGDKRLKVDGDYGSFTNRARDRLEVIIHQTGAHIRVGQKASAAFNDKAEPQVTDRQMSALNHQFTASEAGVSAEKPELKPGQAPVGPEEFKP